jgi:hypothetical protein
MLIPVHLPQTGVFIADYVDAWSHFAHGTLNVAAAIFIVFFGFRRVATGKSPSGFGLVTIVAVGIIVVSFFFFKYSVPSPPESSNISFAKPAPISSPRPAPISHAGPTPNGVPTSTPFPTLALSSTAQQRAMKLYPELAVPNSKINQEFIRRYHQYQKVNPAFFNDPEWPTTLARECQAAVRNGNVAIIQLLQSPAPTATPHAWMWESKEARAARDAKNWNDALRNAPPLGPGEHYAPFIGAHPLDQTPHP